MWKPLPRFFSDSQGTERMWNYSNPVNIEFGSGALRSIGALVDGRRYALVTYGEPVFQALAERIELAAGAARVVIRNIDTNPDFVTLTESCRQYEAADGDFAHVRRFLETGDGEETLSAVPIIAIPTTSGTGSEVTRWATVWDTEAERKYSLNLSGLYPETALVDPELMLEAPRGLTISTGLDALSHSLESIWNVNANPVSSALACSAARDVIETLPALADDLNSLELRTRMARAALIAGLAFSNTKTALAHSVSYPITLKHGVPHGIACSFSLPMVMRWVIGNDVDCDVSLMRIFGPDLTAGAARLEDFLEGLGVATSPGDHGIEPAEWKALLRDALAGERGRNFLGDGNAALSSL